jgi:hypothetical protein
MATSEDRQAVLLRFAAAVEQEDWECFVGLMREHAHDAVVQCGACRGLAKLAELDVQRAAVVAARSIEAVVAALRAFPAHVTLQSLGVLVLCKLTYGDACAISHAGALGGVDAVVAAMRTCVTEECLQHGGLRALAILICNDAANAARAEAVGAVQAVVHALCVPALEANPDAHTTGAMALFAMVTAVKKQHRLPSDAPDVIEAMLRVLRVCDGDRTAQYRCMGALQGFVQNRLNAQHAVACGAFEAVLQLLPSCTGLEPLHLQQACLLLKALCITADAAAHAARVGAIDVLMAWLRQHPLDELVQMGG